MPRRETRITPASAPSSLTALLLALTIGSLSSAADNEPPVFERDVLPIFTRYCFNCHGKSSPQVGLDLRTARLALRGSQNGPVIVAGSSAQSLLWKKISSREMPLAQFKLKLSEDEIETVRRWIEGGAISNEPAELPEDVRQQFARYEQQVLPILQERCIDCHGVDDQEAGLELTSLESLVRGSRNGPVIVEGFSEKSVLVRRISGHSMPPPEMGQPLTAGQIRAITGWIDKGRFADFVDASPAPDMDSIESSEISEEDRQFWAFQRPVASPLPKVAGRDKVRTPIDQFVLAKLESHGLTFSRAASRSALLRRAYFDLTGLPPTPEEARTFLDDMRADSYERLVDRLLASPRYGERWGRFWLDAVGYVDTSGKDFDPNTVSLSDGYWRYRDYVIEATNKDTPWDQFLVDQIAGDELVDWRNATEYTPDILERLTATGFLRNVLDATNEDISDLPFDRYEALFKLMERVSTSTLGMTLACARCHSHKFDPIPQTDYYRFLSLFTAAYNPTDWLPPKKRHLFHVPPAKRAEIERRRSEVSAQRDELQRQIEEIRERCRARMLETKLEQIPESKRADVKSAIETRAGQRSEAQRKLAAEYEDALSISAAEIDSAQTKSESAKLRELKEEVALQEKQLASLPLHKLQALWDVGEPPTIRLLHRGDVDFAGPVVQPGFLSVLSQPGESDAVGSPEAVGETSGLRLAFAQWLTDRQHPLTARVIVNRIWHHHFGRGIVDTPGNFGAMGSRPSHPALLDWLSVQFMDGEWSAKKLHRMVMTSAVYRQTSSRQESDDWDQSELTDPDNRLLWRMNLRRLDAEALRDSIIATSGQADNRVGGPPVMLKATPSGQQVVTDQRQVGRRSVYLLARRANPQTFLTTFDYPTIDVNCTRRTFSATPLQSLALINSEFLATSARHLADRVESRLGSQASPARKVEAAYWMALSRRPSDDETAAAISHMHRLIELYTATGKAEPVAERQALEHFAHMLQCCNEFLYVD